MRYYHPNDEELLSDQTNENEDIHKHLIEPCKNILLKVFDGYKGHVSIKLWNNEIIVGAEDASSSLVIKTPRILVDIMSKNSFIKLAEAHLRNELSAEGDIERIFDLLDFLQERKFSLSEKAQLFRMLLKVKRCVITGENPVGKNLSRRINSRSSISHHYDVHNDFYSLFLDTEMVYSCAYFENYEEKKQSLDKAQQDKLEYICKKLRLKKGEKLLDIGCGWGGLAFWAARHYGVQVHGVTLSQEQLDYATQRAKKLNLDQLTKFELKDYRELDEDEYDKIVSVGMFEHIGIANFSNYFATVSRLLKNGGLFLNHGITNDTGWRDTPSTRFINTYIFPDGELARVSDVTAAMENQSLEILDVEALRPHYALTLRHWIRNLERNKKKAIAIAGERIYRLWQLYMAGSAHNFTKGSTGLYQILASKNRQPWPLPLRREDLYH
ncbi:MAG: cyclopropane-fatty-acyl-phospholipid synthase [Gammaproteobacteria bacterium]|nr:cyclopropane-fatty-acyl-phospholipid synthase [Gammaproteobacteria bacterium]|tara:strand:- start:16079 stop:17398 length:1320 start_codon:yes stop_codon:yes gene_type:complete